MNWHRNSHRLAHTLQISNMYSISYMADVEMISPIYPSVPSDGRYNIYELLPQCLNSGRLSINTVYFV